MAVLLEDIVKQALNNNTNLYLSVELENPQYPSKHYRYMFNGLRYPRQRETVKSSHGHIFKQLLMGNTSDRWSVYPWRGKVKMVLPFNITQGK